MKENTKPIYCCGSSAVSGQPYALRDVPSYSDLLKFFNKCHHPDKTIRRDRGYLSLYEDKLHNDGFKDIVFYEELANL